MAKRNTPQEQLLSPLEAFAKHLTDKFAAKAAGEPEDQLKPPTDTLFTEFGKITSRNIVLKGESKLQDRLGRPDFAAHEDELPIGFIELKAPGKGANPERFKGHDKEQWKRFKNIPNLIYTDGNEWALYQDGELIGKRIKLEGDVTTDSENAVNATNAQALFQLFAEFTSWTPIIPKKPKELAAFLAPFCRLIRDEVLDALKDETSPLHSLRTEIQALLFPDASEAQFADAYAETVTFALLLAQMEGANVLDLSNAYDTLEHHHALLSRSLQFLTDKEAQKEISASLSITQRVINEIDPNLLKGKKTKKDPWLFFYEDFLAEYDPALRKQSGVYYTPIEVVNCQVRLIDEILNSRFNKEMGFVESGVATLDPATGTGTYLLAIIEHSLNRVEDEEGAGAVKGAASSLVKNLHGFEWMVGPYAVAQLRFSQALAKRGVKLPDVNPGIYLTNTLESPHTKPPAPPLFHKPIASEHERALKVKESERILVCLGNPPYGRHEASTEDNHAITGGWVRYGDKTDPDAKPILEDFLEPARQAGHGVHLKNIYNLYVYFIRWSLWKVFEHSTSEGPGILSFITASSYLDGDAFSGIREHMRRTCDRIDIIDLGGEGRGTRKDENVFAIQTPVAIFIASRDGEPDMDTPAKVRYSRIEGEREEKLAALDSIKSAKKIKWEDVPSEWQAPFRPKSTGTYSEWPLVTDLLPWQNNGVKAGRTWVIDSSLDNLGDKLKALITSRGAEEKQKLFKDSPTGRKATEATHQLPPDTSKKLEPVNKLANADSIPIAIYGYRSFDRQYIIADARFIDRPGPQMWQTFSDKQIFFSSLFNHPLGNGPAMTVSAYIPDLHYFRGSYGAKEIMPLYTDAYGTKFNIMPGLLALLNGATPEELAGYIYALLAQPDYTSRFANELSDREVRVPLTKDGKLFKKVAKFGKELIWLHTYGERMTDGKHPKGRIPKGEAKCTKAVSDSKDNYPNEFSYDETTKKLHVGDGVFAPVSKDVYEFEVSGLKVVQSWLGYRMKDRKGKKSSPLDDIRPEKWTHDFTRELLELLWVLEQTIAGYPEQKKLLGEVLTSDLFTADELPPVPDEARKAPKDESQGPQQGQLC